MLLLLRLWLCLRTRNNTLAKSIARKQRSNKSKGKIRHTTRCVRPTWQGREHPRTQASTHALTRRRSACTARSGSASPSTAAPPTACRTRRCSRTASGSPSRGCRTAADGCEGLLPHPRAASPGPLLARPTGTARGTCDVVAVVMVVVVVVSIVHHWYRASESLCTPAPVRHPPFIRRRVHASSPRSNALR